MKGWFSWILVVLLAALFLYAGISKIPDPVAFARDIEAYRLLPGQASLAVALWLPWLEVLAALALVWPAWRAAGRQLLLLLLTVFQILLLVTWFRGLDIECGCFGGGGSSVPLALLRNLGLMFLLGLLWVLEGHRE